MVLGDSQFWANRFKSTDERILERIAQVWPACLSVLAVQPEEDTITINLVHLLRKDPVVRRICHWVDYQFEPFGTAPNGAKFSKGKIDMAVLLDWEHERYVAYECKKLNVVHAGGRKSLATEYVAKGMMRFMTEQYAEGLPVGCMLGYVLDGDISFAKGQVTGAINAHGPLALAAGPAALVAMGSVERFITTHTRAGNTTIELRHAFVPFAKASI
jgi:hypothetical protein